MTQQVITAKVRLKPTSKQAQQFEHVSEVYRKACNIVSEWYFDNHFNVARKDFNRDMYYVLKNQFPLLNTAMVQSVYRTVKARYDSVKTQLTKKPYKVWSGKYDKKRRKIYLRIKRDLEWLQRPITFRRKQADYLRNTNYSFTKDYGLISLNVLDKRIKVDYDHYFNHFLFDFGYSLGTAKLVKSCNHWFLHIPITIEVPELQDDDIRHVVGIDRGLNFIATCYDEKGKTKFISGKHVMRVRNKYKKLRANLQAKGTKSAKRRLKKLGQRENRWMTDVNHQISKALVNLYGKNTLFVLEDLTNVTFETTNHRKKENRYAHNSWSFYQLEQFLTYKAKLNHSKVIEVEAQYTSQRCVKCGRINKDNRDHDLHLYKCDRCDYSTNDDRIAAMNIQYLGTQYVSGVDNPKFIKIEQ